MPPELLLPYLLPEVIQETPDTKTYRIKPQAGGEVIAYKPGQIGAVTVILEQRSEAVAQL